MLYLAAEIMGEFGLKNGAFPAGKNLLKTPCAFHREAAVALVSDADTIVLAPRGHLKTEFVTVAGSINFLLRNPNHRLLIVSETPKLAMKILMAIKTQFQKNDRLRRLFPEYRIDDASEEGTQTYFRFACYKGPERDYSVEAVGIGGATAGGHFDRIIGSDILSDKTVPPAVTADTMMKTWHAFMAMEPLLDKSNKKSHRILEGTCWNEGDAYSLLLKDPGYADWKKIVYQVWADVTNRIPLWPELMTPEDIDKIRGRIKTYLFSCNYLNSPMPDPEEAMFHPSYFKYYAYGDPEQKYEDNIPRVRTGECPCCGGPLNKAVTMDPAIGKKKKNDRTAIVTSGVCPLGSLVIISVRAQRVEPGIIVEDLYNADQIDKPSWIGIETVAFQKLFMYILYEESKKEGRYPLVLRQVKSDEQKERRIGMLAAYARSRGLWVRAGDHDELMDECLKMTLSGTIGLHDDIPDAAAFRLQYMARPEVEEPAVVRLGMVKPTPPMLGSDLLERVYDDETLDTTIG